MKKFLISSAISVVILSAAAPLVARNTNSASQEKNRIVGEVTAIDWGARRVTIRSHHVSSGTAQRALVGESSCNFILGH